MSLQKKQVQPELFTETGNEWYHFLHMQPVSSCQGATKTPDNIWTWFNPAELEVEKGTFVVAH